MKTEVIHLSALCAQREPEHLLDRCETITIGFLPPASVLSGEKECIRIDRTSIFGNPFIIGPDGSREEVIEKFRRYFCGRMNSDSRFKKRVHALKGGE